MDEFVEAATEERQHLLREGLVAIVLGLLTPFFFYVVLAALLTYPGRRFGFRSDVTGVLAIALLIIFGVMLLWSWIQVRPLAERDARSQDPRYGRPKVRASEVDDERYDHGNAHLTWGVMYNATSWFEALMTFGSRNVMQGVRSLAERSRLNRSRLMLAATLLLRAGQGEGLPSATIPDDAATMDALMFLWRNRYLKAEGVLSRTRLLPNDKGLRVLQGEGNS